MILAITAAFIVGYLFIASEHFVKINKAATALLTGVLCWTLHVFGSPDNHAVGAQLMEQAADIAGILFFLMGAMTIVEIIDAHSGFDVVTTILSAGSKRRLLWLVGVTAFFLSAVLDNLTTTIVMVSLLSKLLPKREDFLVFTGVVIIAVNAGGAWTPIGDVTSTMLWIAGRITSLSIIKLLFAPSLVCAIIPLVWVSFRMKDGNEKINFQKADTLTTRERNTGRLVFFLGVGALLLVPVFKAVTHLPPFVGMIFGLGILWIVTEVLHRKGDEEKRRLHSVTRALQRIDMPSIMFFLGILSERFRAAGSGRTSGSGPMARPYHRKHASHRHHHRPPIRCRRCVIDFRQRAFTSREHLDALRSSRRNPRRCFHADCLAGQLDIPSHRTTAAVIISGRSQARIRCARRDPNLAGFSSAFSLDVAIAICARTSFNSRNRGDDPS